MARLYTRYHPVNYGIAITSNPDNTPIIDIAAFLQARFHVSTPQTKKELLDRWLAHEDHSDEPFQFGKKLVEIVEGDEIRKRYKIPAEMSPDVLWDLVREKAHRRHEVYNATDKGGHEVFRFPGRKHPQHGGGLWLEGRVLRRGKASEDKEDEEGTTNRSRWLNIGVRGYATPGQHLFSNIRSDDSEFILAEEKPIFRTPQLVTTEVAALLYYATLHPDKIKNLERALQGRQVWLPIHPFIQGDRRLDRIVASTIIENYTRKQGVTRYHMNTELADESILFDPLTLNMIHSRDAKFVVLPQATVLQNTTSSVSGFQKAWYEIMDSDLRARGYKPDSLVVENKGTEFESVAIDYISKDKRTSVRLMFYDNCPPLVRERRFDPRFKVKMFESHPHNVHPIADLLKSYPTFDDATRRNTHTETAITTLTGRLPEGMYPEYRRAIEQHYHGRMDGFRAQIPRRQHEIGTPERADLQLAKRLAE